MLLSARARLLTTAAAGLSGSVILLSAVPAFAGPDGTVVPAESCQLSADGTSFTVQDASGASFTPTPDAASGYSCVDGKVVGPTAVAPTSAPTSGTATDTGGAPAGGSAPTGDSAAPPASTPAQPDAPAAGTVQPSAPVSGGGAPAPATTSGSSPASAKDPSKSSPTALQAAGAASAASTAAARSGALDPATANALAHSDLPTLAALSSAPLRVGTAGLPLSAYAGPSPLMANLPPAAALAAIQSPLLAAGDDAAAGGGFVLTGLSGRAVPGLLVVLATALVAAVGAGNIRIWQERQARSRS